MRNAVFGGLMLLILAAGCSDDSSDPAVDTHHVSGVSPSGGTKGTVVVIQGNGFVADTVRMRVFFSGRIAQLLSATETELAAVVPAGAGPGFITVSKDGNAVGGPYFNFVYTATVSTVCGSVQGFADGPSGTALFNRPRGLALDAQGNLMVADEGNQRIRIVFPNGSVNTFCGSGLTGHADGPPGTARFDQPYDIAYDAINQEYYVADRGNHCIRKVTFAGDVSTVAGIPMTPGYVDGAATAARLNEPTGVAWRGEQQAILIADQGNHCIRQLDFQGILSTFAGTNAIGFSDGSGAGARFNTPNDVCWDTSGFYYVTDFLNHNIRRISPAGEVITVAGTGAAGFADGPTAFAQFNQPTAVSAYHGLVLLTDGANHRIRSIVNQQVTTIAGTGTPGSTNGGISTASFSNPGGIIRDRNGNYYVSDTENHRIRKITLD